MEQRTKEQILNKHGVPECNNNGVNNAMDEWGKQQSIAFARWIGENGYAYIGDNWYHMDDEDGDNKLSEEELYNLFIKDTEEKTNTP